jgi:hypothetical protein
MEYKKALGLYQFGLKLLLGLAQIGYSKNTVEITGRPETGYRVGVKWAGQSLPAIDVVDGNSLLTRLGFVRQGSRWTHSTGATFGAGILSLPIAVRRKQPRKKSKPGKVPSRVIQHPYTDEPLLPWVPSDEDFAPFALYRGKYLIGVHRLSYEHARNIFDCVMDPAYSDLQNFYNMRANQEAFKEITRLACRAPGGVRNG